MPPIQPGRWRVRPMHHIVLSGADRHPARAERGLGRPHCSRLLASPVPPATSRMCCRAQQSASLSSRLHSVDAARHQSFISRSAWRRSKTPRTRPVSPLPSTAIAEPRPLAVRVYRPPHGRTKPTDRSRPSQPSVSPRRSRAHLAARTIIKAPLAGPCRRMMGPGFRRATGGYGATFVSSRSHSCPNSPKSKNHPPGLPVRSRAAGCAPSTSAPDLHQHAPHCREPSRPRIGGSTAGPSILLRLDDAPADPPSRHVGPLLIRKTATAGPTTTSSSRPTTHPALQ